MNGTIYGNRLSRGTQVKRNVGNHWLSVFKIRSFYSDILSRSFVPESLANL